MSRARLKRQKQKVKQGERERERGNEVDKTVHKPQPFYTYTCCGNPHPSTLNPFRCRV